MSEFKPCNKCGKESNDLDINENIEVDLSFNYGSRRDGTKMSFSLCDDCLDEIINGFKIEPDIDDPYAHWNEEASVWSIKYF